MSAPPSTEPALDASGLVKRFGPVIALDGVSVRLAHGETLALYGPNGAGKSTLVRVLTLGLRPDAGRFRVEGRDPRYHDLAIRARLGVISHQSFLYDELTARENLCFFARLYGLARPRERAAAALARFEVDRRADEPVRVLSRGMQQRVALARALVHDPPLVFLDEPFTGLDLVASRLLRATLDELRSRRHSLVLVTHDLRQGLEVSDRWLVLSRGRVVGEGLSASADVRSIEELFPEPQPLGRGPA